VLNSTEELIQDIRDGKMIIIMDDEDRENEGDFIVAAEHCTAETVNFMSKHGRGLICLTLTDEKCKQLSLGLMVRDTQAQHSTNFTLSIEAAEGVTTGISAADRARTIQAAVAMDASPTDIIQPGHIFPLMAQSGGVLTRAGHTEAGCDFSRCAGVDPSAVIVEILNDDGSMARRPDLEKIALEFDMKIGTIADLIKYRVQNEKTVHRESVCSLPTEFGDFTLYTYQDELRGDLHMALVKGSIKPDTPTLVRVHIANPFADLTATTRKEAGWPLRDVLRRVSEEGEGVVVILNNQIESSDLLEEVIRYSELSSEADITSKKEMKPMKFRQIGLGAQILSDVGVRKMRVMSNPRKYHALSGFGLEVVEYVT
jgi:3,4-dihydroxy 2-butanone 4-phosphate synthase/GTP cyclohydrolase II